MSGPDMMQYDPWHVVSRELDLRAEAGQQAHLWLRDDDAMAPGPALERLLALCQKHDAPLLLCVIPMRAEESLAHQLANRTGVEIAAHGAWHKNHAPAGRKSEEMAIERGRSVLLTELTQARERLIALFGDSAGRWYVPPWNRISSEVAALLPQIGFAALSTFAELTHGCPALAEHNTHVDLIDWRAGRVGRSADVIAARLAEQLTQARLAGFRPVGVLTHHLDHDDVAWSVLEQLLAVTAAHPATRWIKASQLLDG